MEKVLYFKRLKTHNHTQPVNFDKILIWGKKLQKVFLRCWGIFNMD